MSDYFFSYRTNKLFLLSVILSASLLGSLFAARLSFAEELSQPTTNATTNAITNATTEPTIEELKHQLNQLIQQQQQFQQVQKNLLHQINNQNQQIKHLQEYLKNHPQLQSYPLNIKTNSIANTSTLEHSPTTNTLSFEPTTPTDTLTTLPLDTTTQHHSTTSSTNQTRQTNTPTANPYPPQSTETIALEKEHFEQGFELLFNAEYRSASKLFQQFIDKFPKSPKISNAYYWLAEAEYVQSNFSKALTNYDVIINQHPTSEKYPEALLKSSYALIELKHNLLAKERLKFIIVQFPNQSVTDLAQRKLDLINLLTETQ